MPKAERKRKRRAIDLSTVRPGGVLYLCLAAESGPYKGKVFTVGTEGATVCREALTPSLLRAAQKLSLPDADVSRTHARIDWDEEKSMFVISDLGSLNGTFVNGKRLTNEREAEPEQRVPIGKGDTLVIGQTTFTLKPRIKYPKAKRVDPDVEMRRAIRSENSGLYLRALERRRVGDVLGYIIEDTVAFNTTADEEERRKAFEKLRRLEEGGDRRSFGTQAATSAEARLSEDQQRVLARHRERIEREDAEAERRRRAAELRARLDEEEAGAHAPASPSSQDGADAPVDDTPSPAADAIQASRGEEVANGGDGGATPPSRARPPFSSETEQEFRLPSENAAAIQSAAAEYATRQLQQQQQQQLQELLREQQLRAVQAFEATRYGRAMQSPPFPYGNGNQYE